MSALDLLRAREISLEVGQGEPAEPTKGASVGVVGTPQAHSSKYSTCANHEPGDDVLCRRNRALAILGEQPERQIAIVAEAGDPIAYVTVAIRGVAVGDLEIPAERYDAFALMALMEQCGHA